MRSLKEAPLALFSFLRPASPPSLRGLLLCSLVALGACGQEAQDPVGSAAQPPAAGCELPGAGVPARVRHVYDGDTLTLGDGSRVRVLGVDAPELGRDGRPDEPLARAARDAARNLLPRDTQVRLHGETEASDHYGRRLAHVVTAQGTNLALHLLDQGLVTSLAVPPNARLAPCYAAAEAAARAARRGLWETKAYRTLAARELRPDGRFHRVRGTVTRSWRSRKGWSMLLDDRVQLWIADADLAAFDLGRLERAGGRILETQGDVKDRGARPWLRVRHPAALQFP